MQQPPTRARHCRLPRLWSLWQRPRLCLHLRLRLHLHLHLCLLQLRRRFPLLLLPLRALCFATCATTSLLPCIALRVR